MVKVSLHAKRLQAKGYSTFKRFGTFSQQCSILIFFSSIAGQGVCSAYSIQSLRGRLILYIPPRCNHDTVAKAAQDISSRICAVQQAENMTWLWIQPSSRGGSLGAAQTASWELANSLMQTLSSAPPADGHTAMNRSLMMQQLQSDAARAMLSSSSPAVTMQAIQLLTGAISCCFDCRNTDTRAP